jgi:hypothetical protein
LHVRPPPQTAPEFFPDQANVWRIVGNSERMSLVLVFSPRICNAFEIARLKIDTIKNRTVED